MEMVFQSGPVMSQLHQRIPPQFSMTPGILFSPVVTLVRCYGKASTIQRIHFCHGMKIHVNVQIGENRAMSSWKGANDPSPGSYSMGIDPRGAPQIVIWEGSDRRWRSGHWNGQIFIGLPGMRGLYLNGFKFYNEEDDKMYITYTSLNSSFTVRFWIKWDGYGQQLLWHEGDKDWRLGQSHPVNQSEVYNNCGIYGKSNVMGSPICECIEGFEPKNIDQWNRGDWSSGCMRRTPLQCDRNGSSDGFFAVERVKLPDYADRVIAENIKECEDECFKNCSCNAYAFVDGIQCLIWSGDLVDVEQFAEDGTTLYVRVANSESGGKSRISNLAIITTVVTATIFLSISIWLLWRFRATVKAFSKSWRRYNDHSILDLSKGREFSTDFSGSDDLGIEGKQGNGPELPLLSFNCVAAATNDFANGSKLGKGGFGTVYKGTATWGTNNSCKEAFKVVWTRLRGVQE
ncbi:hypothetical protein F0562_014168 [Nyssa sinensis]|uniref:Apple domain-containing protein n=1 Tax=Nyssa sinensis TaxID=561372 RepID=A0A5J4ZR55_9ASTE|nr:hypothetical protein F0562_014168 [Nyssa sinensis]